MRIFYLCVSTNFYFTFNFFFDPFVAQESVNFHVFVNFPVILWLLNFSFMPCGQRRYFVWLQSSWMCWLVLWPNIQSVLENVPCALRRMCVLLVLDKIVGHMSLEPGGLECCSNTLFPYWFLCLNDLSIVKYGVLKSPTIIILLFISPF